MSIKLIIAEIKLIQLHLYLAKRSAKRHKPLSTLVEVESHINHSIDSINHLISHIDDLHTKAESNILLVTEQRTDHEDDKL